MHRLNCNISQFSDLLFQCVLISDTPAVLLLAANDDWFHIRLMISGCQTRVDTVYQIPWDVGAEHMTTIWG